MMIHDKIIVRTPIFPIDGSYDKEFFLEALYLSSVALYNEVEKRNFEIDFFAPEKLSISLLKYLKRASYRCTPFGLFAGISISNWGDKSEMRFSEDIKDVINRKTRLDMNLLCSLIKKVEASEFVKDHIKYYPNSTLYKLGNNYRFIEYYFSGNRKIHKITKLEYNHILDRILKASQKGLYFNEIVKLIISENEEFEETEVAAFLNEIIESQILISELEPTVSGLDLISNIINILNEIERKNESVDVRKYITCFKFSQDALGLSDKNQVQNNLKYNETFNVLKELDPNISEVNLFQTDLYKKPIFSTISSDIKIKLNDLYHFLNKITPIVKNKRLEDFRNKFMDRYEEYEVPLSIALDSEAGLGYPSADIEGVNELVDDLNIVSVIDGTNIKVTNYDLKLFELINNAQLKGDSIIELKEEDFAEFNYETDKLPITQACVFKIIDSTTNTIIVENIGGNTGVNLIGRFAATNEEIAEIAKQLCDIEKECFRDKIVAEILHLPESRTGNILYRPNLRNFEIEYLAKSQLSQDEIVRIEDLNVRIAGDKVILWSKKYQKEVVPMLSNAHNYMYESLPIYYFLCDLSSQYYTRNYLNFSLGAFSEYQSFIPRIQYKDMILHSARWYLNKKEIEKAINTYKKKDDESIQNYLSKDLKLPSKFLLCEGDNELYINITLTEDIRLFLNEIKNKDRVKIKEALFGEENCFVKSTANKCFTNECIAFYVNKREVEFTTGLINFKEKISKPYFVPGSDWIYYKIYCGVASIEEILLKVIWPELVKLMDERIIEKWFFVRYADPEIHLRIRFKLRDNIYLCNVLKKFEQAFSELNFMNVINRVQLDTYKRELERYSDNVIDEVESLFSIDSTFLLNSLSNNIIERSGNTRWLFGLKSVDKYLDQFGYSISQKYELVGFLAGNFFKEHGGGKKLKVMVDNKYRRNRKFIEEYLNDETDPDLKEFFAIRKKGSAQLIEKVLNEYNNEDSNRQLKFFLSSFLHMSLNRLFVGKGRSNEFIVYEFLTRYYKSCIARSMKGMNE